jgi:hypothetical protein
MNTGDPHRAFYYQTYRSFNDRKAAEEALHILLAGYRRPGTEWFDINPEDAERLLYALDKDDPKGSSSNAK